MKRLLPRFARALSVLAMAAAAFAAAPAAGPKAAEMPRIASQKWSFNGPFGKFDRGQLQRGYKVYKEVCGVCHSMSLLHFRNLGQPGGPEFSEPAVRALAASVEVADGPNDQGEMFNRPGRPPDRFPPPFANEQAARAANNGAYPPDLSVMAKAREHGADYLYALLVGYKEPPGGVKVAEGMHYNLAFPGHQIAMPPPLSEGQVEYTDGTSPTVDNYARDVSAFMMWAAEPKLEERLKVGFRMMIYLVLLAGFLFFAKQRIWSRLPH